MGSPGRERRVARAIHDISRRRHKEFVPVNCGAIPQHLLESEFFGHRKGAYTGANADAHGYLDRADGGTLFLDEVGELSLDMQVKLLRAIDGGNYSPLGDSRSRKSDFRLIAATNRNLKEMVKSGKMREDFFFRIDIVPIDLPPLRDRRDDIPLLIDHFLRELTGADNPPVLPGKVLEALYKYEYPGNVREMQNIVQRYLAIKRLDFLGHLTWKTGRRNPIMLKKGCLCSKESPSMKKALLRNAWPSTGGAEALQLLHWVSTARPCIRR